MTQGGIIVPAIRIALLYVLVTFTGFASAQPYPAKPVRLISYSGAAIEALMRVIGHDMQGNWGQPLVIENRPGANGVIAGEACAKAAPDGYTLCMVDRSFMVLP